MLEHLLAPFHTLGALALTPIAAIVFFLLLRRPAVAESLQRHQRILVRALCALCLALAAYFIVADLATLPQERPYQDDEAAILSVSAAYLHGQPMYPDANAPMEYSILYGPATFLLFAVPMLFHAESLIWFQAWVALCLTLTLLFGLWALRSVAGSTVSILALGYAVAVIGMKAPNEWSNKGDPWILLFVSVGIWAALRLRPRWAELLIAVSGAFLLNLKVTLLPLALLPFLLLWDREKIAPLRKAGWVALTCLLGLGFFLIPNISLANYRHELMLASRHGISHGLLAYNVIVFVRWFALPLVAAWWYLYSADRILAREYVRRRGAFLALLLVSSADVVLTGAKYGAGDWHLTPLTLPFALLIAEMVAEAPTPALGSYARRIAPAIWVFVSLGVHGAERIGDAVHTRYYNAFMAYDYDFHRLRREMLEVQAEHPHDTLQVGVSGGPEYTATWMRYLYIVRGQPLFLDPNTRTERDASYVPITPAVMSAFTACRISLWLIPRGEAPFSMGTGYANAQRGSVHPMADPHMYPEPFPSIFASHFHKIGSTADFELWACNRPAAPSADLRGNKAQ